MILIYCFNKNFQGPRIKDLDRFKIEYTKFKLRYEKLQKINGRKNIFEKSTSD